VKIPFEKDKKMKKFLRCLFVLFSIIVFLPYILITEWYKWIGRAIEKDLKETYKR